MEEKKLPPLPKNSQPAFPASTSAQKGKKAGKREWYSVNFGRGFWQQLSRERKVPSWVQWTVGLGGLIVLTFGLTVIIGSNRRYAPAPAEDPYKPKGLSFREGLDAFVEGASDPFGTVRGRTEAKKNLEELKKLNREVKRLNDKLEGK